MPTIEELNHRISQIEERNKKVELDKKWETSFTRRFFIATFTYLSIALYMNAINVVSPWQNAIIPTVGFLLSTLTLPSIKKFWEKNKNNLLDKQSR